MKNNNSAIFIFTKDRPNSLKKTLNSIKCIKINKYIMDDSFYKINQIKNQMLISSVEDARYVGRTEFDDFSLQHKLDISAHNTILRKFGNKKWNLGFARNFALLLAKSLFINQVLFMDDDIELGKPGLILELFKLLNKYDFLGAHITGMSDDSIIGHISKQLNIDENSDMLSGGFLVFNPLKTNIHFTNFYNEDWIWLYLQLKDKEYLKKGEVVQSLYDPFANFQKRIIFQEYGEIMIDGIVQIYQGGIFKKLMTESFWETVLKERKEYLSMIHTLSKQRDNVHFLKMICWLRDNYFHFRVEFFKNAFETYFSEASNAKKLFSFN